MGFITANIFRNDLFILILEAELQEVSDATLAFLIDEILTIVERTSVILRLFYSLALRDSHLFTVKLNEGIFGGICKTNMVRQELMVINMKSK